MTRTRALIFVIVVLVAAGTFNTIATINGVSGLRDAQEVQAAQQRLIKVNQGHIKALVFANTQRVVTIQAQRSATIKLVCHTANELVRSLRTLIITGAQSGKVFNKLFEQFHAPPFAARVRLAYAQARTLQPLDCPSLH